MGQAAEIVAGIVNLFVFVCIQLVDVVKQHTYLCLVILPENQA